jgi:hypothetical protein
MGWGGGRLEIFYSLLAAITKMDFCRKCGCKTRIGNRNYNWDCHGTCIDRLIDWFQSWEFVSPFKR